MKFWKAPEIINLDFQQGVFISGLSISSVALRIYCKLQTKRDFSFSQGKQPKKQNNIMKGTCSIIIMYFIQSKNL